MCGLTGSWQPAGGPLAELAAVTTRMTATLRARGPDDGGVWCDPDAGLALGHRRLAVIDLSPAGAQPMVSACGRFVIIYNGEVYNFHELATELPQLGGHSDTEVILEGCARWGVEATVARLIGMFAFALWDRRERRLTLVRDRLGIKPLYWGRHAGVLLFGSELKALRAHPAFQAAVDPDTLAAFLRHACIPAPWTIHPDTWKVEPGCLLHFGADLQPRQVRYWDTRAVARQGRAAPLTDLPAAMEGLHNLLLDAVGRRMVADVPLGAFLSGGIDSSLVVALMQAQSPKPVKTFAIGFAEEGFDEASHARQVAAHLGTDHTELYVDPAQALAVIPRLPEWYDEPFADTSQIPTFLVSQLARRQVTVALSGDGGDELFAGYDRYQLARGAWHALFSLPQPLRRAGAGVIQAVPVGAWDALGGLLPAPWRPATLGHKAHKLAEYLQSADTFTLFRRIVSQWPDPQRVVPGAREPASHHWDDTLRQEFPDFLDVMRLLDLLAYLPDDILTKVDRASMAVSLEVRVPLLDHRLVALSWQWPASDLIERGQGKQPLRRVLRRYLPPALLERPKQGFTVPLLPWLRGPLREWAETLLSPAALAADGLLDPAPIRRRWEELQRGERAWHYPIWNVLMYQAWRQHWR